MFELSSRIEELDTSLFEALPDQLEDWDRRSLLGLHAAVAATWDGFAYLEIGSYLGGSLQVLIRDPRCQSIVSIDPRLGSVPDNRAPEWQYEDNSTEHMIRRLRAVPGAELTKLVTLERRSDEVTPGDLPDRPSFCFIDGEHTDEAVLRDAELCLSAMGGEGVVAFHDYSIVQAGIRAFLDRQWRDVSMALAFTGAVFAVEFGSRGALRLPVVERAIASTWHAAMWKTANRWRRSPHLLFAVWQLMPHADELIANCRRRLERISSEQT
jgi:hypothetical protein